MRERPITRSGCKAAFRIRFERKLGEWVVGEFKREHNHDLVPQLETQFLRSHRTIKDSDKAQIIALHNVGVKSNQIMDHMIQQAGGYENIGFTSKDLYNYLATIRNNSMRDGDAECALAYLQAKADMDSSFFFQYTVDEESRLVNLFWTDSQSRLDYACFGDVVAFDTTYKKNIYKKPLVILVGVNHHRQTIVFGFGLLVDETVETYTWVLQNMPVAMNNKTPISVMTDGDKAMSKAIKTVFPKSRHRLCVWHLERNAFANLHDKVYESFIRCMVRYVTPDEFEDMWKKMVDNHNLHNHEWLHEMYAKKMKWAEAYMRGHFFSGCRSTQRCEAMNAFLNRFLDRKTRLYELFQQVDRALSRIRHNEMGADFSSNYTDPILITGLAEIEKHAATIFTREIFSMVQEELLNEQKFIVLYYIDKEGYRTYTLSQYASPDSRWEVVYCQADQSMKCSCLLFESYGYPCGHLFAIMKVEHLKQIPPTCIMNRWLKTAKSDLPCKLESQMSPDIIRMARFSALSASCSQMCYFDSRTTQGFEELKVEIARLTRRMEELYNSSKEAVEDGIRTTSNKANLNVRDPVIVKTKGDHGSTSNSHSHAKVRRCSNCKDVGHTRRTCPSTHIQQGERVDGDNVPESMEDPAVGSPDLETNYYNFL
nr:protein FAR1-RELATED SEQUENCE 5-like [Quercus suber]